MSFALDAAQANIRLHSNLNDSQTFALKGHVRPVVELGLARDQGSAPGSQAMPRMFIHFSLTAAQRADLEQLLLAQQNRRSKEYRKFLTPEQYADRFGLNTSDIEKVTRWLENNGFANVQAARSRAFVSFSGTVAQVQAAFHTSIHSFSLNGETRLANVSEPQLPKALEGVAETVFGLHNFPLKAHSIRRLQPRFTASSGTTYLVPDDWETIYNVKPLYATGLDGSALASQPYSIVVVGQSDVQLSDIDAFRAAAGLAAKEPTVLLAPGDTDPGVTGDEAEADFDLEWAGAIAKNASILFVVGNGVEDAVTYAIDNDAAPILSTSYGVCEADLAPSDFATQESLFQHAAAIGMTIVASSGDAGAADCDTGAIATHGLAVDYPASSEYVTGLGGTEFTAQGAGTYFSSSNNSSGGSALSYIPEIAWDDSNQDATGGGVSALVTKPSWQTGTGVPSDGYRDVPDIAFTASLKQDGLLICSAGSCTNGFVNSSSAGNVIGGTSTGPPPFAGVLALLVQKTGTPLGLLNPNLYSLAAISANVFNDVTQGNNQVVCKGGSPNCPNTTSSGTGEMGYTAGVGYDQTTGWGSLNSYNFVEQWSGDIQLTASPVNVSVQPGGSVSSTITIAPQNNFSGPVSLSCTPSGSLVGVTCSLSNTTVNTSGSTVVTITESSSTARVHPLPWFHKMPPINPAWPLLALVLGMAIYMTRRRSIYQWGVAGLLALTLGAVSCGSGSASSTFTLTCDIPTGQVSLKYNGSCTATGGKAPYTYSVDTSSPGSVPPGLSFNTTTGAITGTPTQQITSTVIFDATDSESTPLTASQTVNFVVTAAPIQYGTVTVTAQSGNIVNTATIKVAESL